MYLAKPYCKAGFMLMGLSVKHASTGIEPGFRCICMEPWLSKYGSQPGGSSTT